MNEELSAAQMVDQYLQDKTQTLDTTEDNQSEQTDEVEETQEAAKASPTSPMEVPEGQEDEGEAEGAESEEADSSDSDDDYVEVDEQGSAVLSETDNDTLVAMGDGEVALGELKAGYMRLQDYTRKTQAVAEDKRRVGEVNERTAAMGQVVMGTLSHIVKTLQPNLAAQPPVVQQIVNAINSINNDLQGKTEAWLKQIETARTESRKQIASESYEAIKLRIPDWGRNKYTEVFNFYTREMGTTPEYIIELVDAGMMAGLYHGMQKLKAEQNLPKKIKPAKSTRRRNFKSGQNAPPQRGKKSRRAAEASKRFNESANINDAVNAFMESNNG